MALLVSKQFKKYLVYAFGEIILVIIGILIALGISNWNKNQELKTANKELQHKVLKQIDMDIVAISNFEKDLDTIHETFLKVLERDYDKSKVNETGLVSTILFEVINLSLDNHVNNLVDNAVLDNSEASQKLIDISSTYKLYAKSIEEIETIIYNKVTDNLENIEKTQPWYTELITDFICRNDCINYLLKNEDHKSRMASLRFLYVNGYGSIVGSFKEDLVKAKNDLESAM